MDRETLKAATRGRRPGGSAAAAEKQETKVSDALGAPHALTLRGEPYPASELDFNDLVLIEKEFGDTAAFFERISGLRLEPIRFLVWLLLRKAAPHLTVEAVGELLPVRQGPLLELLHAALDASGMTEKDEKKGAPETA